MQDLPDRRLAQRQPAIGRDALTAVVDQPALRVARVGLVQPVELVQHGDAFGLRRRDRAEQVPQRLEVSFHLASTADDEPLVLVEDAVHAPARHGELLEEVDALTRHLPITDQERRRRQPGEP